MKREFNILSPLTSSTELKINFMLFTAALGTINNKGTTNFCLYITFTVETIIVSFDKFYETYKSMQVFQTNNWNIKHSTEPLTVVCIYSLP